MSLFERLEQDVKEAMRARDEVARDTLRMVISTVKKKQIDSDDAVTDDDVVAILKNAKKTRTDSAEQFDKADRKDLAQKERAEIDVLEKYLPKQLAEGDVRAIVQGLVEELGIESKRDLGKLMKALMSRHKDEIDGRTAQRIAGELVP